MEQLIITIEGKSNADLIMRLMRKFNFVKSVVREKTSKSETGLAHSVNDDAGRYNWINPTRPATDEEFEQMALEMDQDKGEYSSKEVENYVNEELKVWRKKKK